MSEYTNDDIRKLRELAKGYTSDNYGHDFFIRYRRGRAAALYLVGPLVMAADQAVALEDKLQDEHDVFLGVEEEDGDQRYKTFLARFKDEMGDDYDWEDGIAASQDWNNWTDARCTEREITLEEYNGWDNPF